MKASSVIAAAGALLAGSTVASPIERRDTPPSAASIVAQIAPSSVSCANTDECRTNEQVGAALITAMVDYEIYSLSAMASIIALIALESGEFKYKRNLQHDNAAQAIHWGQGTSNMQMFKFNLMFANSFPELKDKVAAIGSTDNNQEAMNKVLDLVADDKYNFRSGPWFFATQCGADVHNAFKGTDHDAAFKAHMACVLGSGEVTADRLAYWTKAKAAFGLS